MAELDEISRVQRHFSPHFLLIFLIYLARALAILCRLGENYSRRSKLLGFRNSLDRYLNNPPCKKGIHITTHPAFQQSNQMLDAKRNGHPKTQTMQTADCRLQTVQTMQTVQTVQTEYFLFLFSFFDSHMFWFWSH